MNAPILLLFIFLGVITATMLYILFQPYITNPKIKTAPLSRRRAILFHPDYGGQEIISRETHGGDKFSLQLGDGHKVMFHKGDIAPYSTEQTMADKQPPMYVYTGGNINANQSKKADGNVINEQLESTVFRRLQRLTAENKRLKANLERGIKQWVELTKEQSHARFQENRP